MQRILLIDDHPELCEMLRVIIADAGYAVLVAGGGDEGIQKFRATPADLVITDIMMPDRSGLEIIVELKRTHPNVKIIAISGGFLKDSRYASELAQVLGVNRALAKPLDPKELVRVIREVLDWS